MKRYLLIWLLLLIQSSYSSAQVNDQIATITIIEQMATFNNGGPIDFALWVYQNIKYPDTAIRDSVSGRVYAKFMVDSTGTVRNVEIQRSARWDLDAEVTRVLCASPRWSPAKQAGNTVSIYYSIPIEYNIKDLYFIKMIKKFSRQARKANEKHYR